MRESVLTKKPNVSVMKPMRQTEVIPFYEDRLDAEMMEVLRTMQSPVDERRRVQQRVVDKHRYDSERQYWMERDIQSNERRLRKSVSLNDIQSYRGRYPKSYLEMHQQQMDKARNESVSNSRTNSSQDSYQYRQYPRQDMNRSNMVYHGSLPSSRLSMANMPGDTSMRETPIRYESSQFSTRSENINTYHPVSNIRRHSSQSSAYEDAYMNTNFVKATDMNAQRHHRGETRKMSLPLPNIKPSQGSEQILVTMSPGQPDRVSIKMAQVSGISSQSSKSPAQLSNNQSSNKVQYNSSVPNGQSRTSSLRHDGVSSLNPSPVQSRTSSLRHDGVSSLNPSPAQSRTSFNPSPSTNSLKNSTTPMYPASNIGQKNSNHRNTPPKGEKSVRRNNAKTENVEKSDKPTSSYRRGSQTDRNQLSGSSSRSNQPEWYNRIDSGGSTKEAEKKPSVTTASVAKTDKKAAPQNQTSARIQNAKPDRTKGIRKTIKEKKPQQSSLRKTNSFKVVGRSTNYFGFVSVADIKAKKKVTFSNDNSERPGTA
ncbi:serine-rich adhesin for platelets-like [Argopecten irradians]|uniref:serine-rich adhesin for platelets-like n=1 Tax=Argopecten irradians TaxID=31199 RepID=UPI003722BA16